MNKQLRISQRNNKLTYEPNNKAFEQTKQGLSMSPADVARCASRGIAVTSQINDSLFFDGTDNPSFELPLEMQRGVDVADVWQAQQSARKRVLDAAKRDKELYG